MRVVSVSARKGGVGTTTVASSLALSLSKHGKVLLVDRSHNGDVFSLLGAQTPERDTPSPIVENLDGLYSDAYYGDYDYVVIDEGVRWTLREDAFTVNVVTNAYMSVKNEVNGAKPDAIVLHEYKDTPLNGNDVQLVLAPERLYVMPHDSAVWRAIDAGLYPNTNKSHLYDWANGLVEEILSVKL
jgi:hypothetical protein